MFLFSKNEDLSIDVLNKMLNKYSQHLSILEHYKNYFDGKQAILYKSYEDPSKHTNNTNFLH